MVKQEISVPLVVSVLDCIKGKPEYIEVLIDMLWLVGIEIESNESKELRHMSEEWKIYGRFVLDLNGNDICSIQELSTRLEMNEIEISGIQKDYKAFEKKLIRINTKLYYTQNKYNLLREENEGFSKLITELYVVLNDKNVNEILSHIQSLIGYFDLDPHRVCDIILTCFESQLQYYNSYIHILSHLEREYIPHILGFKFRQHNPTDPSNTRTPDSLFIVTAYLIDYDIITIGNIYNHLYPTEENLANMFNSRKMYVEQYNKSLKVITINGIQTPTNKNDCNIVDNQHIQLLCSLLRIGSWENFMLYYKHLSSLEINILYDKQIITSLCTYLLYLISPLYENSISIQKKLNQDFKPYTNKKIKVTSEKSLSRVYDYKDLLNTLDTVLSVIRYMVITDITLFTYICRLLRYYINQEPEYFKENENHQLLMKILSSYLVPSLSLVNYNPALSHELWTILDNFPFYQRYEIYSYWQYLNSTEPILEASCKTMENNATQKMKRLTKDNGGIIGRQISILTHSNPLSVFEVIFRQIESYDNLIGVVVDSARCYTYLTYDILFYYFLYQLSKDRSELKSDGENFEDWLCNLSRFSGLLANKYHFTDLTGIFEYISNTLIKGSIGELLILNSLIQEMGGVEIMNHNNITESQLLCSSGGMLLVGEKSFYNYNYRSEKISKKLRNTLMSNNLLTRLLIQLGIERSRVIYDYEDTSKKMLYSLLDTTHLSLSLLAYLCFRDNELYASFTNSIEHPFIFKEKYNMDMEVVFHLLRNKMKQCYLKNENDDNNIWYPYSEKFKELLKRCLKPEILDSITIELYITFWILSYPDVKVPREQYDKYIRELEDKIKDEKDIDEKKELKSTLEKVKEELSQQGKDYLAMDGLLKKNKEIYLKDITNHKESINIFIKYCIKPRILFSYDDAIYSATFVEKINTIGTPYFSTIQFYYKISDVLFPIIPKLSEREASNLGLFLCELWRKLNEWRSEKNIYNKECESNPGFCKKYRQLDSDKYGYDEYVKIYSKMHKTQIESFLNYLKTDEYSNLRNSLIVLKKMIDVYPMIKSDYDNLLSSVKNIITNKPFEDVTLFAKNYNAELIKNDSRMINYKAKPTIHSNISNTPNTPRENVVKKTVALPLTTTTTTANNSSSNTSTTDIKREVNNQEQSSSSEASKRKEPPTSNENVTKKARLSSSNLKIKEENISSSSIQVKREGRDSYRDSHERERSHSHSSSHRNDDRRQITNNNSGGSNSRGGLRKEEGEVGDYQNRNKRDYSHGNNNDEYDDKTRQYNRRSKRSRY